jgi:hypothetical protein
MGWQFRESRGYFLLENMTVEGETLYVGGEI